jgi:hypothetical protein
LRAQLQLGKFVVVLCLRFTWEFFSQWSQGVRLSYTIWPTGFA